MNELTTQQLKLMFGLIGLGFVAHDIPESNHVTLTKDDGRIQTKIVLIPKTNSNEKETSNNDNHQ